MPILFKILPRLPMTPGTQSKFLFQACVACSVWTFDFWPTSRSPLCLLHQSSSGLDAPGASLKLFLSWAVEPVASSVLNIPLPDFQIFILIIMFQLQWDLYREAFPAPRSIPHRHPCLGRCLPFTLLGILHCVYHWLELLCSLFVNLSRLLSPSH